MGLAFNLILPADKRFLCVGEIPELTASAIYPPQGDGLTLTDSGLDLHEFSFGACQTNHEKALDNAIASGMVTPLNPLSFEAHTFPFGAARRSAVISIDDFKRFAESLQIEVLIGHVPAASSQPNDDVTGTKTHLTIRAAASALAEKYGFNENTKNTMLAQLFGAAEKGDIVVRHPHTLLPYTPNPRRDFYELVRVPDLNEWLEKQGVEYQLDNTEQEQRGDEASEPERIKNSDEIPGKMPLREVGKLAIQAAWKIECKTKRRASAKDVMTQLQAWADAGKKSDTLIKSLPAKRAVQWLTAKGEHREYTIEACGKTLDTWHKSRQ